MADIGSTLRETRMRERIDITTVESATKIRAKYLRALENEEWDQLPGPTFVRTFLRTYGDYLGLDSKNLVEEYKQRFERPGPQDLLPFASRGGGGRRQRPVRVIPPFAIVAACVVLLLVALFALGTLGGNSTNPPDISSTPTATATPGATSGGGGSRRKRTKKAKPPVPTKVSLQIVPQASVNVCLVNAAGAPLIRSQTLSTKTKVYRSKRMKVTFGNGQVRMRLAGKSYDVPDTDHAVGYALRPGKAPRPLPDNALPTCA